MQELDCSISIANTLEILQSYNKPSICSAKSLRNLWKSVKLDIKHAKVHFRRPKLFKNIELFEENFYLPSFLRPSLINWWCNFDGWPCLGCIFKVFDDKNPKCTEIIAKIPQIWFFAKNGTYVGKYTTSHICTKFEEFILIYEAMIA